jgi:transketolase
MEARVTLETKPPTTDEELDLLCINTIRTLAMDAVEKAKSGHPGAPMGMAPMAYMLWTRFLRHDPGDPTWPDRDRFVLSAGHASMLLYSLMHLTGYEMTIDDLKAFRQWGSKTPGHPENFLTPGVETTTGPLGQGFATGVGMAMAERLLADTFNKPGFPLVDHFIYGIVSDGDLMEGVSGEAASLAGTLQLGKIVYLYDDNDISIDGPTDLAFRENVGARFEAYGWHVQHVDDGNDVEAISWAIKQAREDARPSLIVVRTVIGFGAPTKAGKSSSHGAPLGPEEVKGAKANLGWPTDAQFLVPEECAAHFRESSERGAETHKRWDALLADYRTDHPEDAAEFERRMGGRLPVGWDAELPRFTAADGKIATRKASGVAINAIAPKVPELAGGSADLAESNNTDIKGEPFFDHTRAGRNIHFGVREFAMAAACNGMALHGGVRPFGATFLIFLDYCRPAVRLAALMEAHSILVFTHDSVGLGEDGPTHQPIEHLASMRAMPNLVTLRPADANETVEAWRFTIGYTGGPVAFSLTRQTLPVLELDGGAEGGRLPVEKGAYVLIDPPGKAPDVILIGSGSEVHTAVDAAKLLEAKGIAARVVSMPSWDLFERQSPDYREGVLPSAIKARVGVEAAATFGWCRWVGDAGEVVGIDRFGASAPGDIVLKELGITAENVASKAEAVLARLGGETGGEVGVETAK